MYVFKHFIGNKQIYVKTYEGHKISLIVDATDYVETVKTKLQYKEGITFCRKKLLYLGKELEDHHRLSDYGIGDGATLHLISEAKG